MRKMSLFLLSTIIMTGCHNDANIEFVDDYYQPDMVWVADTTVQPSDASVMAIETGENRDLKLETQAHVIEMVGRPATKYKYYIWTGDKNTANTDPDIIVDQGDVMVRTQN